MPVVVIYVDADANPMKSIIAKEAALFRVKSVFVCSFANHFQWSDEFVQTVIVDKSYQSADMYIANNVKAGDIVITDDYGLACLVLGRSCLAISSRGKEYTNKTIDQLLMSRHVSAKERLSGRRTKGPKAITREDEEHFQKTLKRCLQVGAGDCSSFDE